jgi:hypothetical protein
MAQYHEVTSALLHGFDLINHRIISPSGPPPHGPVYYPGNPTPSALAVQDAQNMRHGIDRDSRRTFIDRYSQNPHAVKRVTLKSEINRELDANTNAYNPRKYPDPGSVVTCFPARRLLPPPLNGSVCARNSLAPAALPASGTNDVAWVVSRF